jgi:hypothetical protein
MRYRVVGVVLLASMASAQTFVVDAAGGPGTDFPDIASAVAAVPDGAVLVVREGLYGSFAITAKSLTILGESGARIGTNALVATSITIDGLAAGQRVALRGLTYRSHFTVSGDVTCQNCLGSILLDGIAQEHGSGAFRLDVDQCAQVQVNHCLFHGANASYGARVVASDVHFVDTRLQGGSPGPGMAGLPALQQVGGRVQLAGSFLAGGLGVFGAGGSSISMLAGDLRVLPGTSLLPGSGSPAGLQIAGAGVARIDPAVTTTQVAPGITWAAVAMPAVTCTGGALDAPVFATMDGPAGDLGLLAIGTPGGPAFVPGWADPLWINPMFVVDFAVLGAPFVASVFLPPDPTLVGLSFGWQGFSIDANFAFQVSNAAWFAIHG